VKILLLNISGLALEAGVERLAVDQHVACDYTHGSSLSEDIEQSRLTGSTGSHQRGQSARFHPPTHTVEQSARVALDLNVVHHVAPGENVGLRWDNVDIVLAFLLSALSGLLRSAHLGIASILLVCVLEVSGNVTTAEDQNFSSRRSRRVDLDCNKVESQESEEEAEENTKVAPDVRVVVTVLLSDEGIARNGAFASYCTTSRADEGISY